MSAKSAAPKKVPITERALLQRINRKLKKENQVLRTARGFWAGPNWYEDNNLGRYYVIDIYQNMLVDHHVDIEEMGRDTGALAEWEALQSE